MGKIDKNTSCFEIIHNGPSCGLVKCLISRFLMWLAGWKVTGKLPEGKKYVLVGEPHTSNWDFILMFGAAYSLRLNVSWLGKHTIFKKPFGTIMRWFGGMPIDRRASHDLVNKTAEVIKKRDRIVLVIGPSGTRSKRDYWKSGFYWMAKTAEVPILCGYLDFVNKIVHIGLEFTPTGNVKADMDKIREFYKDIRGKYPEFETEIRLKNE